MDLVSISIQIMSHMKDIFTWIKPMLLESLQNQMEDIMRVSGIMINSMGMEFGNSQMEIFLKGSLKMTLSMGLVYCTAMDRPPE